MATLPFLQLPLLHVRKNNEGKGTKFLSQAKYKHICTCTREVWWSHNFLSIP